MKRAYKDLEMKGKGYKKKLDELQNALNKHLEQYVIWLLEYVSLLFWKLYKT